MAFEAFDFLIAAAVCSVVVCPAEVLQSSTYAPRQLAALLWHYY